MMLLLLTALPLVAPVQERESEDLAERLTARAERALDESELDGLVVVVGLGDDVLLEEGWGRLPGGHLASPTSLFRAAPLVESLAAVALLQLAANGEVDLDEKVGTYVEGLEWEDAEVTLHHVLSHTSGLIGWSHAYQAAGAGEADVARLVGLVRESGVQTPPGSCFEYSESNPLVVGAIVEAVTEEPLAEAIDELVLRPAGLERTGFGVEGAPLEQAQATCSTEIGGEQIDVSHGLHPFGEDDFCTTARDLFQLRRSIYAGSVDEAVVEQMTETKRLADGTATGYGYGVGVSDLGEFQCITTGGSSDGTTVHVAYYPEPEVTVVLLVAAERAPLVALERDLARLVLGIPLPGIQDVRLGAEETRAFVGRYQVGCTTFVVDLRDDGHLSVEVADRPSYRLLYQGQRRFVAERDPDISFEFVVERGDEVAQKFIIDERGRISEAVRFQ